MTSLADILDGADLAHTDQIQREILEQGGSLRDSSWHPYAAARRQNLETRLILAKAPQEQADIARTAANTYAKATLASLEAQKRELEIWLKGKSKEYQSAMLRETQTIALAVAKRVAGRDRARSIALATVISLSSLSITSVFAYDAGHDSGEAEGHEQGVIESRDEKAAADWANTPDGKWAYAAAKMGVLTLMRTCALPNAVQRQWEIIRTLDNRYLCVAAVTKTNEPLGWYIDATPSKNPFVPKLPPGPMIPEGLKGRNG